VGSTQRSEWRIGIARVIFCITAGEMVLLHGFEKKTQRTPPHDIGLALKRKREIE
jgi:phage-related protein